MFSHALKMSAILAIMLSSFIQGNNSNMFIYILPYFTLLAQSQVVSLSCTRFCPEVLAEYYCEVTGTLGLAQWTISGSVDGTESYGAGDAIGRIRSVGDFFSANKTGITSFSLNFTADVEFNNSVMVECRDLTDSDPNTRQRQCTIKLEGKRVLANSK